VRTVVENADGAQAASVMRQLPWHRGLLNGREPTGELDYDTIDELALMTPAAPE
jgi:hypothetical protein